ncbi:MAG: hypothetical protein WBQ23_04650 [Bacteroidota bacterium]
MISRKVFAASLFMLCFACIGCEEDNSSPIDTTPDISGNLIKVDGCKNGLLKSAADNNQGCVQFTYDPVARTLTLLHVNAGFNCCPKAIRADVVVEDSVIRITESESGGQCRCECLFGLHILVENIPAQTYTIKVIEPILNAQETPLEFTVDFSRETEGEHCVPRNFYPWGI